MMPVVGIRESRAWWYTALVSATVVGLLGGYAVGVYSVAQADSSKSGIGSSILVGDITRTYSVHLPTGHTSLQGLPVLLAFNTGLGNGTSMNALTQLNTVADSDGFAVVYPDGYDQSWNDGRGTTAAQRAGVDDVTFVSDLINHLVSQGAEKSRFYATGFSGGAMFTEYLGCRLATQLAGIAPVAGPLPTLDVSNCLPARPLQVLLIAGGADPTVPFGGGTVGVGSGGGNVLSAQSTASFWRAADNCAQTPVISNPPNTVTDGTSVQASVATGCAGGSGVEFLTILHGGHTWPGGLQYLPAAVVGKTTRQFGASAQLAAYFGLAPGSGAGSGSSASSGSS